MLILRKTGRLCLMGILFASSAFAGLGTSSFPQTKTVMYGFMVNERGDLETVPFIVDQVSVEDGQPRFSAAVIPQHNWRAGSYTQPSAGPAASTNSEKRESTLTTILEQEGSEFSSTFPEKIKQDLIQLQNSVDSAK